jgi:predicted PurR-regulated permease PerM
LAYYIPVVTDQVRAFVSGIPDLLTRAEKGLADFAQRLGVHIDTTSFFQNFEPGQGRAFNFLGRITSFTSGVVHVALVLILGPLLAFYLLVDLPKIQRVSLAMIPAARREEVRGLAGALGETLGGFFRGQLVVALLVGVFSAASFYVVGLPYWAMLGGLTAILALVPLLGIVIAAIPVLFVAAASSSPTDGLLHVPGGWKLAVVCAAILAVAQQLDLRILSPRLLSRSVRLHPVTVLLSLLVGGTLQGLWGMLLAVPVAAALKVILLHLWDTRSQWPPRMAVTPGDGHRERRSATPASLPAD